MLSRIFKNVASLAVASIMDKVAYVVLFAIIARKLTRSEFGTYNLVLTLIFIGGMIVNFGMEGVIIREVAKSREKASVFFANSVFLALLFSLVSWPLMFGLAYVLKLGPDVIFLMGFGGGVFVFMGFAQMASAVIKGHERMDIFAGASICLSLIGFGLSMLVLWVWGDVSWLVGAFFVTEGLRAVVLICIVHRRFAVLRWQLDRQVITQIFRLSVPFALLMAYGVLSHRTDLLMMGWLKPLDEVAVYGMAAKFADFLSLITGSLTGALYPLLSKKVMSAREELWGLYNESIAVFAIVGFGAALAVVVLAQPLISFLFGDKYLLGVTALRWLAWGFLFSTLSGPIGILLLASGDQMNRLLMLGILLLGCNIFLNIWLIPLYSYNGAALSSFLTIVLGFIGRLILSRKYFGRLPNLVRVGWRALSASLLMGFVLSFLTKSSIIVSVIIGGITYFGGLALFGEFREARYEPIKLKILQFLSRSSA